MTIFAIIRSDGAPNNEQLSNLIGQKFPNNLYRLGQGQWLVSANSTAEQICETLGVKPNSPFTGTLVVAAGSYFGVHAPQLWEWIKSKWSVGSNAS